MKTCAKCNVEKNESEFHKSTATKDGLQSMYTSCKKEANKAKVKVDPIEEQLIADIETAREKLRKYRIDRATQQEMERQVAQAAVDDLRKKLSTQTTQAGGTL